MQSEPRFDFGLGLSHCTSCRKSTRNRGCKDCELRFCDKCFHEHIILCETRSLNNSAASSLTNPLLDNRPGPPPAPGLQIGVGGFVCPSKNSAQAYSDHMSISVQYDSHPRISTAGWLKNSRTLGIIAMVGYLFPFLYCDVVVGCACHFKPESVDTGGSSCSLLQAYSSVYEIAMKSGFMPMAVEIPCHILTAIALCLAGVPTLELLALALSLILLITSFAFEGTMHIGLNFTSMTIFWIVFVYAMIVRKKRTLLLYFVIGAAASSLGMLYLMQTDSNFFTKMPFALCEYAIVFMAGLGYNVLCRFSTLLSLIHI